MPGDFDLLIGQILRAAKQEMSTKIIMYSLGLMIKELMGLVSKGMFILTTFCNTPDVAATQ